jgi:PAS domain S-box-containing protein
MSDDRELAGEQRIQARVGEALFAGGAYKLELTPEVRAELLDPKSWADMLGLLAHTLNVAVALVDPVGELVGICQNPQPIWSLARDARSEWKPGCAFCLGERVPCTAASDAVGKDAPVLARDYAGFAHTASSLSLGGVHLGALLAGQVFDRYPEPLLLERLARDFGLSAQQVWHLAGKQRPITRNQLTVYGGLLGAMGQTFLRDRFGVILEKRLSLTDLQFQLLVDGVSEYALFTTDFAGFVTSWNRGARRLFGYTEGEILAQPFTCLFLSADIEDGLPKGDLQTVAREGQSANERWYVRKDGSRFFASAFDQVYARQCSGHWTNTARHHWTKAYRGIHISPCLSRLSDGLANTNTALRPARYSNCTRRPSPEQACCSNRGLG